MVVVGGLKEATYGHLFGSPDVEIHRFDLADVGAHGTVDARASYAQEHAPEHIKYQLNLSLRCSSARTDSTKPIAGLYTRLVQCTQPGTGVRCTIALAVRASLVLWPLQQLTESARMTLCCCLVLFCRHGGGEWEGGTR